MTRTVVSPGTQVLTITPPSNVITSTTNNPTTFPAAGPVPATINIQGVVNPSTGAGNMTVTTHNPTLPTNQQAVSTYRGPVNINLGTGALNGTVVGKNPANPGVNRAPATQSGVVASQPPS